MISPLSLAVLSINLQKNFPESSNGRECEKIFANYQTRDRRKPGSSTNVSKLGRLGQVLKQHKRLENVTDGKLLSRAWCYKVQYGIDFLDEAVIISEPLDLFFSHLYPKRILVRSDRLSYFTGHRKSLTNKSGWLRGLAIYAAAHRLAFQIKKDEGSHLRPLFCS